MRATRGRHSRCSTTPVQLSGRKLRGAPYANAPAGCWQERELDMSMREAKAAFDAETFRRWKRAKKKRDK
jgi:hypothetical protein